MTFRKMRYLIYIYLYLLLLRIEVVQRETALYTNAAGTVCNLDAARRREITASQYAANLEWAHQSTSGRVYKGL